MNEVDTFISEQIKENKTPSVQYVFYDKETLIHRVHIGFTDLIKQQEFVCLGIGEN